MPSDLRIHHKVGEAYREGHAIDLLERPARYSYLGSTAILCGDLAESPWSWICLFLATDGTFKPDGPLFLISPESVTWVIDMFASCAIMRSTPL